MSKFLVHLKQKESDAVEHVTSDWRTKEQSRDQQFNEQCGKVSALESRLLQKSSELQRREEKIVHLEDELKHKIQAAAKQLQQKEDEICALKQKFKDERVQLEHEKKRLQGEAA